MSRVDRKVGAIILAAGQGSRYRQVAGADQDKLMALCEGRDGVAQPVIEQVLRNLPACVETRLLVTTSDRPEVARLARAYGCQVLLLASAGMGDSIAAAVAACAALDGWLVVLGDMPFILPSSIERIVEAIEVDTISVPVQGGVFGHPVGFGRSFGAALMALSGDRGAKPLFASAKVVEVSVEDPGVLWDVDVPEALKFA
ncbi:molybdopterin-guanine dinucleotide biosynthesis protein MobA [Pseudomonas frederiksbergensis]|uniref:Molybdopterin-guanine dinucleotide biosynthesis protein MobA n=1 Tax=Pseudomonas frederiksbergensis TaxID=104087 RepID=A0A1J0EGL5_9PSED|nr:nucleotidyltransferase family protein [Pseudomonas frederiksbergensis]APC15182.1 molybdopterin-guanine dinucleotide biosynthesis protein MobA [Pseudomonas frederiksbergensis]